MSGCNQNSFKAKKERILNSFKTSTEGPTEAPSTSSQQPQQHPTRPSNIRRRPPPSQQPKPKDATVAPSAVVHFMTNFKNLASNRTSNQHPILHLTWYHLLHCGVLLPTAPCLDAQGLRDRRLPTLNSKPLVRQRRRPVTQPSSRPSRPDVVWLCGAKAEPSSAVHRCVLMKFLLSTGPNLNSYSGRILPQSYLILSAKTIEYMYFTWLCWFNPWSLSSSEWKHQANKFLLVPIQVHLPTTGLLLSANLGLITDMRPGDMEMEICRAAQYPWSSGQEEEAAKEPQDWKCGDTAEIPWRQPSRPADGQRARGQIKGEWHDIIRQWCRDKRLDWCDWCMQPQPQFRLRWLGATLPEQQKRPFKHVPNFARIFHQGHPSTPPKKTATSRRLSGSPHGNQN